MSNKLVLKNNTSSKEEDAQINYLEADAATINLSPHENILTIALINIHYLYNIKSKTSSSRT